MVRANVRPYLVGNRVYGGGRPHPTSGPVDPLGYRERDAKHKARKAAILRRMKAKKSKNYLSADALREV